MAYFDHHLTQDRPGLLARLAKLFETPHDRRVRARAEKIAALRALSDAQLAGMGLRRADIVLHVFAQRGASA